MLWNEVLSYQNNRTSENYGNIIQNARVPVTIDLQNSADITIYNPMDSTNPISSISSARSIELLVPDEVIVATIAFTQPRTIEPVQPPINFQASADGEAVQLSWESLASHNEFFIRRMGKLVGKTSENYWTDSNVPSGYGYEYSVEARDSSGNLSEPVLAKVMLAPVLSDLILSRVSWIPEDPEPGDSVLFSATIKNIGNSPTPDGVTHGVKFMVDDQTVSWSASWRQPILPGESVAITSSNGPGSNMYWVMPDAEIHTVSALVDDVDRILELNENNNLIETLLVNLPDLTLTSLSWSPENPEPGDLVLFSATIKNIGNSPTLDGITHGVKFMVDNQTASWSASWRQPILPGESVAITASNGPGGNMHWAMPDAEIHTVSALVDDVDRILELDENNNLIETLSVDLPDLIFSDISWSPENPEPGDPVLFSATIKNIGNSPTPDGITHGVKFMVDDQTASWSASWRQPILPGESVAITASNGPGGSMYWAMPDAEAHEVNALVDDVDRILESDENNNSLW
ncbi:CARDB domain-containing protein [Cerasicoccus arenae]|nr:CARDB domain-containing protein [Cerasicoccus arenae]MBK1860090.1 hypothetical protein [Cerasicoccus arenae]